MLTPEERQRLLAGYRQGMTLRGLSRSTGITRRAIRRALQEAMSQEALPPAPPADPPVAAPPVAGPPRVASPGGGRSPDLSSARPAASPPAKSSLAPPVLAPPVPSKLAPFEGQIRRLVAKNLKVPRILREIRAEGYAGGRTMLGALVRRLRGAHRPPPKVFRRFETDPSQESQCDWSPYRVRLAGQSTVVHCFSLILSWSRMLFVAFYRNEQLPTLLHAHTEAFAFFQGVSHRLVYDNLSTVVSARARRQPVWNPQFLEFAHHYGFRPWACRPAHPDRKGKIERPFAWIEPDYLRGSEFASWDDLNLRARHWLDTVANVRCHGTIRERPQDRFLQEQPLLIRLPSQPWPTWRQETRVVQLDGYVPVDASYYPATRARPGQRVSIRVHPWRVEILDGQGQVTDAYPIPDRPARIPFPHQPFPKVAPPPPGALEAAFLGRFPGHRDYLDGLKIRIKGFASIHLHRIAQLANVYPPKTMESALDQALTYRNFNAHSLARILERQNPGVLPETRPLLGLVNPAAYGALDDVDLSDPSEYDYDTREATGLKATGLQAAGLPATIPPLTAAPASSPVPAKEPPHEPQTPTR